MSIDLEELKRLADAATPGPWGRDVWYGTEDGGWVAIGPHLHNTEDEGDDESPDCPAYDRAKADAAFISAAREAVPALVAEVERLQSLLRDAQTWVEIERHRAEQAEGRYVGQCAGNEVMGRERDALRAEVERLRAENARLNEGDAALRALLATVASHISEWDEEGFIVCEVGDEPLASIAAALGTGAVIVEGP